MVSATSSQEGSEGRKQSRSQSLGAAGRAEGPTSSLPVTGDHLGRSSVSGSDTTVCDLTRGGGDSLTY